MSWQSWSPLSPHPLRLPAWDYCPLEAKFSAKTINKPQSSPLKKPISYWCSWYAYGERINEQIVFQQAKQIHQQKLSIDYLLIDDGWTKWGDWQTADQNKFPSGIANISQKLRSKYRLKTGLWWAPFLVAPNSIIAITHPEWLVRNQQGKPINGFRSIPIIDQLFYKKYVLDLRQKNVQQYLRNCVDQMINDWSISLLKMDFLYAPYFDPSCQSAKEVELTASQLLDYIRDKYPQVFTIACGCPFDLARGRVDSVRISKDNGAPPPYPAWMRRQLYRQRLQLLDKKAQHPQLWQGCLADPDVRIHSFDDKQSTQIWSKIEKQANFIRGYGDILN